MSRRNFEALLRDLCQAVNMDDPTQLLETGHLRIDDFDIGLFQDEQQNSDAVFVYVDFGPIPEGNEQDIYRSMLECNLYTGNQGEGVLGIHPDTKHAIFSACLQMADVRSGRDLADMLCSYVDQAEHWRHTSIEGQALPAPMAGSTISSATMRL